MAPRLFRKLESKFKSTRQTPPLEPALAAPPTPPIPSPTPSQPASEPTSKPSPRPTPSPTPSAGPETSSLSLQERLWNQAYDELKANEFKIVEAYEKILSAELHRGNLTSAAFESRGIEIGQTREARWGQMKQLVQAGLERTQKEAAVKRGIDDGLQAVHAVKGAIDKAVQAAPEAAIAWVGVCFGLEILSNPVTEAGINRRGIAYVISRMEWYWNLVYLLLDENTAEKSTGLRAELEKHIIQLYQKLLLFQIKSVCLYSRNQAAVLFRDMFKLDDWDGQLNEIMDAENVVQRESDQYNTEQVKSHLQNLATIAHSQEKRHQDDKDEQCLKDLHVTDPSKDKKRIQDTKGGLLKDSYGWILDHSGFQRFRDDPQSRLLWIKGDPGKGKTMLLCGIIDEL
ncbi:hypothetical protein B0J13DRAFT_473574, partial [Dactylonectria estremocensis]